MISRELAQSAAKLMEELAKLKFPELDAVEVRRWYRGMPVEAGPSRRQQMRAIAQELRRQA